MPNLKALAEDLPGRAYSFLERPPRYAIKTVPRQARERVKPQIVAERRFETIHLLEEMVAEFDYRPVACKKSYRMIVLRKRLGIDKGQMRLFEEYRYFFYITNDRTTPGREIVFLANDRCDQENLIAQLKGGVHALTTPVDDLVSNWAYMVMARLAWSLKAWSALLVPVRPGRGEAPGREADAVADGVRDVLRGGDPDAVPDRAGRPADRLPVAVLEPVARGVPAAGGAAAGLLAVLSGGLLKSGSGCPDPCGLRTTRGGEAMKQKSGAGGTGRGDPARRTPYPARRRMVRRERLTSRLFSDYMKEDLRQIWEQPGKAGSRPLPGGLDPRAEASGIKMLQQMARTLALTATACWPTTTP